MIFLVVAFIQKYKKLLLPTTVIMVGIFFVIQSQYKSAPPSADVIQPIPINEISFEQETPTTYEEDARLMVEVKGAVNNPGVYELSLGDRVLKAIELAGGYLPTSNSQSINHAQKVADEMVIYVPVVGEEVEQIPMTQTDTSGIVNINQADITLLTTLPGIGPAKAEAIITYRNDYGPFKETEDLMKITGIGKKTYEKLESLITVK